MTEFADQMRVARVENIEAGLRAEMPPMSEVAPKVGHDAAGAQAFRHAVRYFRSAGRGPQGAKPLKWTHG